MTTAGEAVAGGTVAGVGVPALPVVAGARVPAGAGTPGVRGAGAALDGIDGAGGREVALDVGAGVAVGSGLLDGVGQMSAGTIPPT